MCTLESTYTGMRNSVSSENLLPYFGQSKKLMILSLIMLITLYYLLVGNCNVFLYGYMYFI